MEWIDINEKKPNDGEHVLFATKDGCSKYGQYHSNYERCGKTEEVFFCQYSCQGFFGIEDVSHWMPMPKAPNAK